MNLAALIPILAKVGAPILAAIIKGKSPDAGKVLDAIGSALGVEPTPEAIAETYEANPTKTAEAIRTVEASDPEMWKAIAGADAIRGAIFSAEHEEGIFAWAWRPGWMYLLALLWAGAAIATMLRLPYIDFGTLLTLTGIYAAFYMGGHTAKTLWQK